MSMLIRSGSSFRSKYADPRKQYMAGRNLENLEAVGALSPPAQQARRCVDEVRRHKSMKLSTERLVAAEGLRTLLSEERDALQELWRLHEWCQLPASAPGAELEPIVVRDTTTPPRVLGDEVHLPIAKLDPRLQTTARRVQLVADSDQDQRTLHMRDLRAALKEDTEFSDAALEDIHALIGTLQDHGSRGMMARADVPMPGTQKLPVLATGTLAIDVAVQTRIVEERSALRSSAGFTWSTRENEGSLQIHRDSQIAIDLPPGAHVILFRCDTLEEWPLSAPAALTLPGGSYRAELWGGGQRSLHDFTLPTPLKESLDISDALDHALVADGVALQRVLTSVSTNEKEGSNHIPTDRAAWEWRSDGAGGLKDEAAKKLTASLDTIQGDLRPGRYAVEAPHGVIHVDIYASGAVKLVLPDETVVPLLGFGETRTMAGGTESRWVRYSSYGRFRSAGMAFGSVDVRLQESMRVG